MSTRIGIRMEPLDVLFFRDGRPFEAGMRATGNAPLPQTLTGAVRTYVWRKLGADFSKMSEALTRADGDVSIAAREILSEKNAWAADIKICGPWLSQNDKPLVSVPADLVHRGKKSEDGPIVRLFPAEKAPIGWSPASEGMLPLWCRGEIAIGKVAGFLNADGLATYLEGGVPEREMVLESSSLWEREDRIGIAVDKTKNSAEDGQIFSIGFMRLKEGVSFYSEVELPDSAPTDAAELLKGIMPFGGDGRRVLLQSVGLYDWPQPKSKGDGESVLLVTSGVFLGNPNWQPDAPVGTNLISAAIPSSVPISGWDLARRRPKPVRHGVSAGSVYFYEKVDCQKSGRFVCLCNNKELNAQGYGLALKGAWKYV